MVGADVRSLNMAENEDDMGRRVGVKRRQWRDGVVMA